MGGVDDDNGLVRDKGAEIGRGGKKGAGKVGDLKGRRHCEQVVMGVGGICINGDS